MDYPDLPGFEKVGLEDSYVLDIEAHPGTLTIRLDLLLLPGHPEHRSPEAQEWGCFRLAAIVFGSVRDMRWTGQGAPPAPDPSGTPDFGSVDSMTFSYGRYRIAGDWGEIELEAAAPPRLLIEPGPGT